MVKNGTECSRRKPCLSLQTDTAATVRTTLTDRVATNSNKKRGFWQSSRLGKELIWHSDFFKKGELLGCGTFGSVHACESDISGESAAVKMIRKRSEFMSSDLLKVRNEFSCWRSLVGHPNISTLYAYFETSSAWCFVMERVNLGTLSRILKDVEYREYFDRETQQKIAAQLAHAVSTVHALGYVHRDISCSNVMLNENMDCKLIDLGLTCPIGESRGRTGTMAYMAPEVLQKGPSGVGADWWSYGIVVFTLHMKRNPLAIHAKKLRINIDELCKERRYQIARETPIHYCSSFPEDLEDFLRNILVIDPSSRLGVRDDMDFDLIKEHPVFDGFDWTELEEAKAHIVRRNLRRRERKRDLNDECR